MRKRSVILLTLTYCRINIRDKNHLIWICILFIIPVIEIGIMYFILAVFASLFVYALAHQQVGVVLPEGESCTDSIPPFQSYHIHALFWSNNAVRLLTSNNFIFICTHSYVSIMF